MKIVCRAAVSSLIFFLTLTPIVLRAAEDARSVGHAGSVTISAAEAQDFIAGLPAPTREALSKDPRKAAAW